MAVKSATRSDDSPRRDIPDGPTDGTGSLPRKGRDPGMPPPIPYPENGSASASPSKRYPQIGDIVLYNHRVSGQTGGGNAFFVVPVIITKVYPDAETCDGVLFNTQVSNSSVGAIPVYGIRPGEGEARWQFK